jgi:hypothetical protein
MKKRAITVFNNGNGSILCSKCKVMLFSYLTSALWDKINSPEGMTAQYCEKHIPKNRSL